MDLDSVDRRGPSAAYPRSAVEDFLVDIAAERTRLERKIADARLREERAQAATEQAETTSRLVRSTLQDLRRELDARTREVQVAVDGIVGAARDRAADILTAARAQAELSVAQPRVDWRPPAEPDPASLSSSAATSHSPWSGADPGAAPTPLPPVMAPSPTTARVPQPVQTVPDAPAVATLVPAGPSVVPATDLGAAPSSNGQAPAGSTNGHRGDGVPGPLTDAPSPIVTAAPATTVIASAPQNGTSTAGTDPDPVTSAPDAPKSSHFPSLRRRRRSRSAPSGLDESTDEFLDFLRGALLDDSPLDSPDPDVQWRWTQ